MIWKKKIDLVTKELSGADEVSRSQKHFPGQLFALKIFMFFYRKVVETLFSRDLWNYTSKMCEQKCCLNACLLRFCEPKMPFTFNRFVYLWSRNTKVYINVQPTLMWIKVSTLRNRWRNMQNRYKYKIVTNSTLAVQSAICAQLYIYELY